MRRWAIATLAATLFAAPVFAAGPYVVDDSGIVDPGTLQNESWYSHSSKGGGIWVGNAAWRTGDTEWEVQGLHYDVFGEHDNILQPQAKHLLWEQDASHPFGLSIVAGINWRDDPGGLGPYAYLPLSVEAGDWDINVNLGALDPPGHGRLLATWGGGVEYAATESLTVVGEVFGFGRSDPGVQLGPRIDFGDALTLDLVYGRNVLDTSETLLTAGLTFRL